VADGKERAMTSKLGSGQDSTWRGADIKDDIGVTRSSLARKPV
jgi:hypothetical protein